MERQEFPNSIFISKTIMVDKYFIIIFDPKKIYSNEIDLFFIYTAKRSGSRKLHYPLVLLS